MKNLRHLLRRSGKGVPSRRQQVRRRVDSRAGQRMLTSEALERRELLAGDFLASSQNPINRFDVNTDFQITARDALGVINYLGRQAEGQQGDNGGRPMFYDVNGDNLITAADALGVINAIGRGEAQDSELIELLLTARQTGVVPGGSADDFNLDLIQADVNGEINVEVGEFFDLEVSYEDLRSNNERLGAFQLITNIAFSQPEVITPVLFETQQLIIDQAINNLSITQQLGTSVTLSIPELPPGVSSGQLSFNIPVRANSGIDLRDPDEALRAALTAFGYDASEANVQISAPAGIGDNVGYQLHWRDLALANLDLPDISIEVNEAAGVSEITTDEISIPPILTVGSDTVPNQAAIPFNLNVFSRTFKQSSNFPFGEPFYASNRDGSFDPATGFTGLRGIGGIPSQGGGIPQLIPALSYPAGPFDAYSLTVFINQPVENLIVSVEPNADQGAATEAILIYGEDDRVPISNETVIIEGVNDLDLLGNGKASIVINATDPNVQTAPVAGDGAVPAFDEGSTGTLNLADLLSGGDPSSVTVTTQGSRGTATIGPGPNFTLTYTPADDDEFGSDTIVYTASNTGGSDTGTIAITINPVNDPPVAVDDGPFSTLQDTPITLTQAQLTGNDSTGAANESDTLTASPTGGTSANGGTVESVAGGIRYTPANGFTGTDTFTYLVNDGTDDSASPATVTINVTAVAVDPPTAGDGAVPAFAEGATGTLNLAGLLGGGDPTSVTVTTQGSRGTATIGSGPNFTLTYTPNNANEFGSDTIVYTASNSGGSDTGTLSITITPVNDAPVANNDAFTTAENTPLQIQLSDLLSNDNVGPANESSLDTLTITNVSNPANAGATLTQNGVLVYTPPTDFFGTDTFTYTISDNSPNGALTATATVTITITEGPNNLPQVEGPLSETYSEDDPQVTISQADLLAGATDDDGDTLSVRNLVRTGGSAAGISISGGNSLTVNPGANGSLLPSQTATAVYTYEIFDGQGAINQTITINITGVNDPPTTGTVSDVTTFTDSDPVMIDVLSVADAGAGEDQPLSITAASLSNPAAGSVSFNGMIVFTPAPGFEGNTVINYTISDGTDTANGSVNVAVVDFVPSNLGGYVFIDRMENPEEVFSGADPIRNGQKDAGEQGLGGVQVRLSGGGLSWTAVTDLNGHFNFANVAPGTYQVEYMAPPNVILGGPSTIPFTIDAAGGVSEDDLNFPLLGLTAESTSSIDILARTYLNRQGGIAQLSNGGREGGLVSFDASGQSNFILAGEGFDGVRFADVRTLHGSSQDMALLTLLMENGDVLSTTVSRDRGVMGAQNRSLRFFGGLDDFSFQNTARNVNDYNGFQAAIDEILAGI